MSDLKAERNRREAARVSRPQLSMMPYNGAVHGVRGLAYGAAKYARANFFGPPPEDVDPVDRFLGYIDAAMRHLGKIAQAVNVAKGTGGDQRAACSVVDDDSSGGFPPSLLPHLSHAIAGLLIAVECGEHDGLLPGDPGEPWKAHPLYATVTRGSTEPTPELSQKDDPATERARVKALIDARVKNGGYDIMPPTKSGAV